MFTIEDPETPLLLTSEGKRYQWKYPKCPLEVKKLMEELDPHKAHGPHDISPYLLKECTKTLVRHLEMKLISVNKRYVTLERKRAKLVPTFKIHDREVAVNYRQASLTSMTCKTLQVIICKQEEEFLTGTRYLIGRQQRFRNKRPCLMTRLNLLMEKKQYPKKGGRLGKLSVLGHPEGLR